MIVRLVENNRCVDRNTISVSLGCWYFGLELVAPTRVRPSEFFERVRGCLERIDGVSDIVIDLMALAGEDEAIELEPPKDPRYGEYRGPHWNFESVEFDVHLPLDIQSELLAPHRALTGQVTSLVLV